MRNIGDILVYLFSNYPNPDELSKARAVKMLYLVDWKSAIVHGRTVTGVTWVFNHYGPYVRDIIDYIKDDNRFEIKATRNIYGDFKELIVLSEVRYIEKISNEDQETINFVIEKTAKLFWNDFIQLIYSTYPIVNSSRYSTLDLVCLANEYKQVLKKKENSHNTAPKPLS